jgi:hypothetical protein
MAALSVAAVLGGCGKAVAPAQSVRMGEQVAVGPITYNVFESQWTPDLPGTNGRRAPKNRFLVLKLSITNGGAKDFALPLLRLEGAHGQTYLEEESGDGVRDWLGLIRVIPIAQSATGRIVFDVPPGSYKVQLVDNGDLEDQKVKFVDIPYNVEQQVKMPAPGLQ